MLTLSKPLSAGQVRTYHEREFASEQQNYWSRDQQGHSEWRGELAKEWGLSGAVGDEHFARLTEGQHPITEAQLVRHQVSRTYEGKNGKEVTSVEHRAGWDATFSAPKSVSLTALVGGDDRVREAHRESVRVALGELERYTQARIGNVHAPETTGKFVAATFEHDTARPVEGTLHRSSTPMPSSSTSPSATTDRRAPCNRMAIRLTALCHGNLPRGAGLSIAGAGLQDRVRQVWAARDQRLHERISRSLEPASRTDQGPSSRAGTGWCESRTGSSALHARPQGAAVTGAGAATASRASRAAWSSG